MRFRYAPAGYDGGARAALARGPARTCWSRRSQTHALYLIGHDETRDAIRTFKVERILDLSLTAADVRGARGRGRWRGPCAGPGTSSRTSPRPRWCCGSRPSVSARVARGDVAPEPGGRASRPTGRWSGGRAVAGTVEIRLWILSWGDDVEVLEPPALRADVAATHARAVARYGRLTGRTSPVRRPGRRERSGGVRGSAVPRTPSHGRPSRSSRPSTYAMSSTPPVRVVAAAAPSAHPRSRGLLAVTLLGRPAPAAALDRDRRRLDGRDLVLGLAQPGPRRARASCRSDRGPRSASLATERAGRMAADGHPVAHGRGRQPRRRRSTARGIQWYGFGEIIGVSSVPVGQPGGDATSTRSGRRSPTHAPIMFSATYNYVGIGFAYRSATARPGRRSCSPSRADHTAAGRVRTGADRGRGTTVTLPLVAATTRGSRRTPRACARSTSSTASTAAPGARSGNDTTATRAHADQPRRTATGTGSASRRRTGAVTSRAWTSASADLGALTAGIDPDRTGRRLPFAAVNLISDPIHGYVELTKRLAPGEARAAGLHAEDVAEDDLLDTAWVQRLRRISQLQSARWVFPTAEHSRFTHGLGRDARGGAVGALAVPVAAARRCRRSPPASPSRPRAWSSRRCGSPGCSTTWATARSPTSSTTGSWPPSPPRRIRGGRAPRPSATRTSRS